MARKQPHSDDLPAILGGTPVRPDGPPDWPIADPEIAESLQKSLADGTWGKYHGPNCEELSRRLTEYHDCEHVILCASGTVAVELALRGLKVGVGDEVVLAAYDFKANFQNILTVGATPVLVDLDPNNLNLDVDSLSSAVTPATKVILASHLHGGIVPMPAVMDLAGEHGIAVIEDACQMPGATIRGKKAGCWGDVGILSFGGSKLLSSGRGGALLSDQDEIVQRIRLYTQRGNEAYPLSELQSIVLLPQLDRLDERNRLRGQNVTQLCASLGNDSGLKPFINEDSESLPGYFKLGFQYDPVRFDGLERDTFAEAMQAEGIAIADGFRSLHLVHAQRRFRQQGDLPIATDADGRVLTLHHPILLGDERDLRQITTAVEKIRKHATALRERSETQSS